MKTTNIKLFLKYAEFLGVNSVNWNCHSEHLAHINHTLDFLEKSGFITTLQGSIIFNAFNCAYLDQLTKSAAA